MAAPFVISSEYDQKVKKEEELVKEGKKEPDELITVQDDIDIHKKTGYNLIGGISNAGFGKK
jgi:hypothetical protein